MKAWKVYVSGTYNIGGGEYVDYSVEGVVPYIAEEDIKGLVANRYILGWISADKENHPQRPRSVREIVIDDYEETDHDFDYCGKDIKEMTAEDLQDLATAKGLYEVPAEKMSPDVRQMREKAYKAYVTHVQKETVMDDFRYTTAPPLVVDQNIRKLSRPKIDPDKQILKEQGGPVEVDDTMSLEELRDIAKGMGIQVKPNQSKKTLLSMIKGTA